jgi:hypothetical protein
MTPILLAQTLFPSTYKNMQSHGIMMYYNDWRNTGLSVEQYKALLRTRG